MVAVSPSPSNRPRTSILAASHRRTLQVAAAWIETSRSRYSIQHFRDLQVYTQNSSRFRSAGVILCTPILSLLTSLLPTLVPLHDPADGWEGNRNFVIHALLTIICTQVGANMLARAGAGISHNDYNHRQLVGVAIVATLLFTGLSVFIASTWRFPIPFYWVLGFPPWTICMGVGFLVVFRRQLFTSDRVGRPMLIYLPIFVMMVSQIVIYSAYCVAFDATNGWAQVALSLFFPLLKYCIKVLLKRMTKSLPHCSRNVAMDCVEICACMFQSMILQSTPTALATVILIGVDVFQGLLHIRVFMNKRSLFVAEKELISTAYRLVQTNLRHVRDQELLRRGTAKNMEPTKIAVKSRQIDVMPLNRVDEKTVSDVPSTTDLSEGDQKRIVLHALQILHTSEHILHIEYFEVAVPIVCAFFMTVASQLPTAIFNPKISSFYQHPKELKASLANLVLYIVLQALSLGAMAGIMWTRFRIPVATQLAFMLEQRMWSIQGNMLGWFAVILHFSVFHYGMDFTLKFQWNKMTNTGVDS